MVNNLISLGQIIKSRGLKGELKIKPFSNDLKQFKNFREVFIGTTLFCVLRVSESGGFVYLKLDGVDSLEQAEKLRNKEVSVRKEDINKTEENEYFVSDLIGCRFLSAELEGVVVDIHQFGAADVVEVKLNDGRKLMFPYLLKLGLEIDIYKKKIEADRNRLSEVMVVN